MNELEEVKELLKKAFESAIKNGPDNLNDREKDMVSALVIAWGVIDDIVGIQKKVMISDAYFKANKDAWLKRIHKAILEKEDN